VAAAQGGPIFPHRGKAFRELMERLQYGLRDLFRTDRPVYVAPSSGTGMMEAAVRCGVRRRVLCLVNGAFSGRFARIARACGKEVEILKVPLGHYHDPARVEQVLDQGRFDALAAAHSESSTGVLNPVEALSWVVHGREDVLFLVDGVSSVGAFPVETDRWALDALVAASQKALGLPPGLAFAVASPRLLDRAATLPDRGLYLDLVEFERHIRAFETPTTPALPLLHALDVQLARVLEEGHAARWERHRRMAGLVHAWSDRLRFERGIDVSVLAPEGYRSPSVTCLRVPEGSSAVRIVREVERRGWLVGEGYGPLKETTLRIGHMGDQSLGALEELLAVLEEALGG
jgi:aspartate aminotransferase-like enzyme